MTAISGIIKGSVKRRKACRLVAPSTAAARYGVTGSDCSPAKKASIMNGVHCQTSTSTSA